MEELPKEGNKAYFYFGWYNKQWTPNVYNNNMSLVTKLEPNIMSFKKIICWQIMLPLTHLKLTKLGVPESNRENKCVSTQDEYY